MVAVGAVLLGSGSSLEATHSATFSNNHARVALAVHFFAWPAKMYLCPATHIS